MKTYSLLFVVGCLTFLSSCKFKNSYEGVYKNINNSKELLVLYNNEKYAHFLKLNEVSEEIIKIDISNYSINDNRLHCSVWKSYNFEFEKKNYPNGVSSNAEITGDKISFLDIIDNHSDDFIKTSDELPDLNQLLSVRDSLNKK